MSEVHDNPGLFDRRRGGPVVRGAETLDGRKRFRPVRRKLSIEIQGTGLWIWDGEGQKRWWRVKTMNEHIWYTYIILSMFRGRCESGD
jgi:hypothetical protein